ncbi:MAG: phage tail tube protein [Planctomycetota bacterium]
MSIDSYGTTIEYGDGSTFSGSTAFTAITEVISITPPNVNVGNREKKHLTSPNRVVTKRPNWKTPGQMSATVYYEKSVYDALQALTGVEKGWRITIPDGSTVGVDAFISEIGMPEQNGDDDYQFELTWEVQDIPAFTAAA